jgi:hypothetical protein
VEGKTPPTICRSRLSISFASSCCRKMGAASSALQGELPERMDIVEMNSFMEKYGIRVQIDMVRFSLLKDGDDKIARDEALQLIENKLPPIYSLNALSTR